MNVFEYLKSEFKNNFNVEITLDTKISDLSIDSIEFLEFVVKLEEKYKIEIDDYSLIKAENINDIVELVKQRL